jgi:phosphate acetyltransferase
MDLITKFINDARKNPKRVVLPEGDDPRVIAAAHRLMNEGIAHPIVLSNRTLVGAEGLTCISPTESPVSVAYSQAYSSRRDGLNVGAAARLIRRPLFYGAMMVREGDADAMVAGVTKATSQVIAAGALAIGYTEGVTQPSSFFIMVIPGPPTQTLVYSDAAVTVDPSPNELAHIAITTARNAGQLLSIEPRVAFLSFSTYGSAQHPRVYKVQEAVRIAKSLAPDLLIDGELQVDSAISTRVAQTKCPDSPLGGQANVLIFPDLDSANIAYKLTQYLAGAQAIGPVMQGFRYPLNDLSRGATVDDIVAVSAIASLQSLA